MDREKVIAWLADEELYYRDHGDTHNSLMACNALSMLKEQEHKDKMFHALEEDWKAMLKEQEEVEPIPPIDDSDLWRCGNCNHQLFRCSHQKYCEMCGREVKWDA